MPTLESDLVVQNITEHVRESVGFWVADACLQASSPEIVTRPWSFMLRYPWIRGVDEHGAVLVKIARHQEMEIAQSIDDQALLARTEKEFEMLSSIANVFESQNGNNEFCFVRPLGMLPQWNALVMEELESQPLKAYYLKPRMVLGFQQDWNEIEMLLNHAACWLRKYHSYLSEVQELPLSEAGLDRRIEQIFMRLGLYISEQKMTPIRMRLFEQFNLLAERRVPVAMLHSDFHGGNILVTPDHRVGALDADMARGPIYQDIAKYFADLKTRSVQVLTRGRFIRSPQLNRCYQAIVNGYFGTDDFEEEILQLFVSIAILEKWMLDEITVAQDSGTKSTLLKASSGWRRSYFSNLVLEQLK